MLFDEHLVFYFYELISFAYEIYAMFIMRIVIKASSNTKCAVDSLFWLCPIGPKNPRSHPRAVLHPDLLATIVNL